MSTARTARLLTPAEPHREQTVEQQARRVVKGLRRTSSGLGAGLNRMVAIQMEAYPADWSDADKREMAERHLFGRRS